MRLPFTGLAILMLAWAGRAADSVPGIRPDALWRVLPVVDEPPAGWTGPEYDDTGWLEGPAAFSCGFYGYQQGATALPLSYGAKSVRGIAARRSFVVEDPAAVGALWLRAEFEDGLLVWLNGVEVARVGFPPGPVPAWNASAATHGVGNAEILDLTPALPRLRPGTNVMALQVFEASAFGTTLFVWPELRANFLRGPLVQNVSTNAATVVWRTAGVSAARVEMREGASVEAGVWRAVPADPPGVEGAVQVPGLREGTVYEYRVVVEGPRGSWASVPARFRTLRSSGPLEFVAVGDTGASTLGHYQVAEALAREAERADFVLHTGDIVYPGFTRGRVDLRCFSVHEAALRSMPWFFTFGNHDVYEGDAGYLESFVLPRNPISGTSHYYSFDHGDAHIVSLFVPWWGMSQIGVVGSDGSRSAQYRWLTQDLASTTKPWKIVFFHQPPRTSGPHLGDDYDGDGVRDTAQMQASLMPLLESLGVDLILNGHDHNWERFAPSGGMHSVVTGGGGAFLYTEYFRDPTSARHETRHHHVRVRIRGREMEVEAVSPDGGVFDRFAVRKPGSVEGGVLPWRDAMPWPAGERSFDGNVEGEAFDLGGSGWMAVSGGSANLGRLVGAVDREGIQLGLRDLMIRPGQTVAVWLGWESEAGTPSAGVADLAEVGAGAGHPLGAVRLRFHGAFPRSVVLLGDEYGDDVRSDFLRPGARVALGQGVFRLDGLLTPVAGARVRQFNRSPESAPDPWEQNANFCRVVLPWESLPGLLPGGVLRIAVTVLDASQPGPVRVDGSHFSGGLTPAPDGAQWVAPVEFRIGDEPSGDFDLDGLGMADEMQRGTDPRRADTDGDGLPDGWEVGHALDPLSAATLDGAMGDPDGDGYGNLEEYRSGTHPRDAAPTLGVRIARVASGDSEVQVRLTWRAILGRRYTVERGETVRGPFVGLAAPDWPRVAVSTNESVVLPATEQGAWYRVAEERAP